MNRRINILIVRYLPSRLAQRIVAWRLRKGGIIRNVRNFEGSLLGDILEPHVKGVSVTPTLGVKFVEPWRITSKGDA